MSASPDPAASAHARIAARKRWHGAEADTASEAAVLARAAALRHLESAVDRAALLPLAERARLAGRLLGGEPA
jgi:hypothetical protein